MEKEIWDTAFKHWWWLTRFGLTPDQVEELPLIAQDRVPLIAALADEIAEEQSKRG